KVLIAGANDGMLHAFRETDGRELWAFIPPDLLASVKNLTSTSGDHLFYVDGSPIAADIKVSGSWKTIVLFGVRRGGNHYYALDITDTTNPTYLWRFTDSKLGETWSERSEEHTSELQSRFELVCRLLPEHKNDPAQCPPTHQSTIP